MYMKIDVQIITAVVKARNVAFTAMFRADETGPLSELGSDDDESTKKPNKAAVPRAGGTTIFRNIPKGSIALMISDLTKPMMRPRPIVLLDHNLMEFDDMATTLLLLMMVLKQPN